MLDLLLRVRSRGGRESTDQDLLPGVGAEEGTEKPFQGHPARHGQPRLAKFRSRRKKPGLQWEQLTSSRTSRCLSKVLFLPNVRYCHGQVPNKFS
jgi:hypothetical protein